MRTPPEYNRIKTGPLPTTAEDGTCGGWIFHNAISKGRDLIVYGSDGRDWERSQLPGPKWEHVSVHAVTGNGIPCIPTWREMCHVKDLFWEEEACVIQYHPPQSSYYNLHTHVLHLWRPVGQAVPMPPLETL